MAMTEAYQAALKSQFEVEEEKLRDRMVTGFPKFWKHHFRTISRDVTA